MTYITLKEAFAILESASSVIVDDDAVVYPSIYELTEKPNEEFLFLQWADDDFNEFSVAFREGDNQQAKVSGCDLFLKDSDGDETKLTILAPKNVEEDYKLIG
jgi:hypothetical protein